MTQNRKSTIEENDGDVVLPNGGAEKTEDVILEVKNTSVTFDMERGKSRVLDDVSLDIRRNEILGIVGESGSGKSMFASALLDAVVDPGVLTGEITYHAPDGESIDLLELDEDELQRFRWEEIAMVFQGAQSSFNPTMTVRAHFEETIRVHDKNTEEGMDYARELLETLHLSPERVLDSYPHELSGGMSQRALIALSLILDPEVLVMDEPTAALDLLMQRSILTLLEDLKEELDITVAFITHDLPLVARLSDRLAVLYAFEFVEVGESDDILVNPSHPYTRALLRAVPNLNMPFSEMKPIKGSSPDPVNIPQGCSYHPRCPIADEMCIDVDPDLQAVGEDHQTACHYWEDAADRIPLATETDSEEQNSIKGNQSDEPVLSLQNVDVHFESQQRGLLNFFKQPEIVRAVDDINLQIYENDVVTLVGESGCGKTTLGRTAIAAQSPTSGSVEYRGQDISKAKAGEGEVPFDEIRHSLQIIHQDPGSSLNPHRRVQQTLTVPLKIRHSELNENDRRERIHSMLEYVGMTPPEDYARRYPHQLSGGEKQRVALIRALFMNPDVILADEAVSALDVSLRVEMMDLMLDLQDQFDTSFIFISHNLTNARYLSGKVGGRIAVMYLGEIVEIGPAEKIIRDPKHPYTKILGWATPDLEVTDETEELPMRGIDIPDPVDPPSGCHFHTRCPVAREVCTDKDPKLEGEDHRVACFREVEHHEYWNSDPLPDAEEDIDI